MARRELDMTAIWVPCVLTALLLTGVPPVEGQGYLEGTITAERSNDAGYRGYWKYCIHIEWDVTEYTTRGVSHIDVLLGLEECLTVCIPGYFAFQDTVGSGSGVAGDGTCTLQWHGMFECRGDPSTPIQEPLIKFEYFEDGCEPDAAGWVDVCFYSVAPPTDPGTFPDALAIRYGQYWTNGDLTGVLPSCDQNYISTEMSTWGSVKALFR
jgi:hypothetical protein